MKNETDTLVKNILTDYTLDQVITLFVQHLRGAGRADETISSYLVRFRRFMSHPGFAGSVSISQFRAEDIDHWAASLHQEVKDRSITMTTCADYIQAIKTLFKFAFLRGYIPHDPTGALPRPKVHHSSRNKVMSHQDLFRLLDRAWLKAQQGGSIRDLAIVSLMADTGLRRKEIVLLTIGNLDLEQSEIYVEQTKNSTPFTNDFTPVTGELLATWLQERLPADHDVLFTIVDCPANQRRNNKQPGDPLHPDAINSLMRRLAKAAGVKGRSNPHALRHLVGQWFTDRLGNLEIVRQKLNHRSIYTTARFYANQDRTRVKAATQLHGLMNGYKREE